ncbi:MAG TPA: hypothetical protein VLX90_22475 [Steroidobacteraceae bacterium]|nr:hypothetical protein [Steroidobacteraceae bacterium]
MKIKIEVIERAGCWQVKVCGLRRSRCPSQVAVRRRRGPQAVAA